MCDNNSQPLQGNDLGADKAPIILPPSICAQATYANRYSIIGAVVNPEKQNLRSIITQMPSVWGLGDFVVGRILDSRRFQFVFPTEESLNRVLRGGPWSFAEWMIVSRRWGANVSDDDLKKVQFWVQISGIPPHFLSKAIIECIGNSLAEVVTTDFEDNRNLTNHIWVLVNWNIDNPLCFKRKFQFADGEISMLSFFYDRLVNYCSMCGMLTHGRKECPSHKEDGSVPKKCPEAVGSAFGLLGNAKGPCLPSAVSETGLIAGPSGHAYGRCSTIPSVDTNKLAETLRYLKAKLGKGDFAMGHRWNHLDSLPNNRDVEEPYRSFKSGGVLKEANYCPMEISDPYSAEDDNFAQSCENGGVAGGKRKRDDADIPNCSGVLLHSVKKEISVAGVSNKEKVIPFSLTEVKKTQDYVTSVTKVNSNSKPDHEWSESEGSST